MEGNRSTIMAAQTVIMYSCACCLFEKPRANELKHCDYEIKLYIIRKDGKFLVICKNKTALTKKAQTHT